MGTAGDVNGDGYSDVIVGASLYDNGETDEGRVFVYHGSSTGLSTAAAWTAESDQVDAYFGDSVGTAGDVNGDGYSDVIVGAGGYDNGETDEGRVFVYHGSSAGLSATPAWTAESDQANAYFGCSVGTAGDVNGDGYSDVIVGASGYDNGEMDEGRAFVYHGSSMGLSTAAAWTAESDQRFANFGISVGTAGDVNGDGYSDIIVGGGWTYIGEMADDRAFVYYGNKGMGLSLIPRQRQVDDSAPIFHLCASESEDAFLLSLLGKTPYGRGMVKLQWEVRPLGTLFDGTGVYESAAWTNTGTSGTEINERVSGLSANTVYHWRVRLRYHPGATPFQQYSRWLSLPWNGLQEAKVSTKRDGDDDGLTDDLENEGDTDPGDADTDNDGILDGDEDANHNGIVDEGETDPVDRDTDNDGIQDGTELGFTTGHATDTDTDIFQPDLDPSSKTDALDGDSDGDGCPDGVEDTNHNGRVDPGETDPIDTCSNPRGDMDGDGDVDQIDANLAIQVLTGMNPSNIRPDYIASGADVNGDNRIRMEEVIYILEKMSGLRPD